MSIIVVDTCTIELSNEDKLLFPQSNITKGNLIAYYHKIAPYLLPLVKNHPIALQRFPDGIDKEGFYQKEAGDYFPDWIERKTIKHKAGHQTTYVLCNNTATLVYLANQAVVTIHHWLSTASKIRYPDRMIFDLDPSSDQSWEHLVAIALQLKKLLQAYDLAPFVMMTGSHGLHITVPLKQQYTFKKVRMFAQKVAQQLVDRCPKLVTLEIRKEKRARKVFIDTLRNQWAQHAVAPYSVRAFEGAPVAAPIFWKQLEDNQLNAQSYTINNIFLALDRHKPLWHDFFAMAGTLNLW